MYISPSSSATHRHIVPASVWYTSSLPRIFFPCCRRQCFSRRVILLLTLCFLLLFHVHCSCCLSAHFWLSSVYAQPFLTFLVACGSEFESRPRLHITTLLSHTFQRPQSLNKTRLTLNSCIFVLHLGPLVPIYNTLSFNNLN